MYVQRNGPATIAELCDALGIEDKGVQGRGTRLRNALKVGSGAPLEYREDGRWHLTGSPATPAPSTPAPTPPAAGDRADAIRRVCARSIAAEGPAGRQGLSVLARCTPAEVSAALVDPWFVLMDGEYRLTVRGTKDYVEDVEDAEEAPSEA